MHKNCLYKCGGLTVASSQLPTQPLTHSPSSTGQGEKIGWKTSWVKTGKLLTSYGHKQKRLDLREWIYCQLNRFWWWETKKKLKQHLPPSFFPGSKFTPSFLTLLPTLPPVLYGGMEGYGQYIIVPLCHSFLLKIFPCSSMGPAVLQEKICFSVVSPQVTISTGNIQLLPYGVLCVLQCGYVLWHGLFQGLQGNICSSIWRNSPPSFFSDLGVRIAVSHFFFPLCLCLVFLSFLKYVFTEAPPVWYSKIEYEH